MTYSYGGVGRGCGVGRGRGVTLGVAVGVALGVTIGVTVGVDVGVALGVVVAVAVAVGVGVGLAPPDKAYAREPGAGGLASQKSWVKAPAAPSTPETYSWSLPGCTVPKMKSKRLLGSFSYRRTSKFAVIVLSLKYTVRHSMLKMRLGALPETEVNTPHVPPGKFEQPLKPISVR